MFFSLMKVFRREYIAMCFLLASKVSVIRDMLADRG